MLLVKTFPQNRDQILIYNEKGNLLRTFEVKENPQRALQLFKKLNSVKTVDAVPVYKTKMFKGVSVWAFYQHLAMWNFLSHYIKYEEVIKFLIDNKVKRVKIDNIRELENYLGINQIKIISSSVNFRKLRSFFVFPLMRSIALVITFLAFLKLLFSKTFILVYTPDKFSEKHQCDFRFQMVYQYLREKRLPYLEVFHTQLNKEFFKNILRRRRLAIYLETFPIFSSHSKTEHQKYDLSSFEFHNQKYIFHLLNIIDKESKNSIKKIKDLSNLLSFSKIKTLVAMDDVRYTNELILACRLNSVKTYGFQHGLFSKYHVGWLNYNIPKEFSIAFDKLFVRNEYWERILLNLSNQYTEDNVEVGGSLKEPKLIKYKKRESKIEKISDLRILVPYETWAPKKEVGDFINRFIDLGAEVFFKVRPDLSPEYQFNQYDIKEKEKVKIIKEINAEILSQVDVIAGTYSAFLIEMIFYEKPIVVLEISSDLGHQLIDDNLAALIKKDFSSAFLLDYINNYQSKKNQAWPPANVSLAETLDKCLKN